MGIDKDGVSYINRMVSTALAPLIVFLACAGNLAILQGWTFFGLFFAVNLGNLLYLAIGNPALLNERGKTKADVKRADRVVLTAYLALTHLAAPAIAGLEFRLAPPPSPGLPLAAVGIGLFAISFLLETWAMHSNRHFERNIRIQLDRGHAVVRGGPYGIIRHPGYLGYILRLAAFPLIVGTVAASIAMGLGIAAMVLRTALEDQTLARELPGYAEYRKSVKHRLIPGIW